MRFISVREFRSKSGDVWKELGSEDIEAEIEAVRSERDEAE
jgi:hypothetical protein